MEQLLAPVAGLLEIVSDYWKEPLYRHAFTLLMLLYVWLWCTKSNEMATLKGLFRHISVWTDSLVYMVLSKDNKGLGVKYQNPGSQSDPAYVAKRLDETIKKRIFFIRHGESDWNFIFNRGKNIGMLFRLLRAIVIEWTMIFKLDSPFLDSPLFEEGIQQALELREYIETDQEGLSEKQRSLINILRGTEGTSIVVSSTLRRAIATTTLALWPRIKRNNEKIALLSHCSEISRNVDTYAISPKNTVADLPFSRVSPHCDGEQNCHAGIYNASLNLGPKSISVPGKSRMEEFNKWAMESQEDNIIVGGHSLWFKQFFNLYLPFDSTHTAKKEKIVNSGVIAFDLYKLKGEKAYYIDPSSMEVVYGGFTKK